MVIYVSQNNSELVSGQVIIIKQISKVVKEVGVNSFIAGSEVAQQTVVPHHVLHVGKVKASPGPVWEHLVSDHHTLAASLSGHCSALLGIVLSEVKGEHINININRNGK